MGLLSSIKQRSAAKAKEPFADGIDPKSNPYHEAICVRVPATIEGRETVVEFRWIKDSSVKTRGAQAVFLHQGEQVPVIVSAPNIGSFSMGINIGISKVLYPSLKEELDRLKSEELASSEAALGYNGATGQAILYRRSSTVLGKGDLAKWRDLINGNFQPLVSDFESIVPFVMKCFGE